MWGVKRNRNNGSVVYDETPKSTSSSLKMKGREVEKASNLILDLKLVSPVPLRRNWTICAKNTILPWTPPLLNPRPVTKIQQIQLKETNPSLIKTFETEQRCTLPMNEEALIQFVPNIDDNIVVCGYINSRTWELVVDSNDLQKQRRKDMRAITRIHLTLTKSNKNS